jgi:hypothetical protein
MCKTAGWQRNDEVKPSLLLSDICVFQVRGQFLLSVSWLDMQMKAVYQGRKLVVPFVQ